MLGDPLMALSEVAALLRRSERTLRRWRQDGLLRDVRLGGSVWIRRSDLERALRADDANNRDAATHEPSVMGPPRR
ncbi:helix-turn-helix domain-containing protein [Belnapia sp. T18]|uniref:Helix-turn-helix domain-containing protein n=2 Tax=Belnapia arida TaxID=2804533 RepID=A0ABS1UD24_9PROT|nr:helix-turn-helix domain-containing protein [Belnapia arida]